ncbi:hypothetical protein EVAR_9658_1 [Eumeta japonica]|uniref:Uncharacterized protein n=1 Tax=Eumeta variegata TaxID=151549 RepID=A0A4C1TMQ9_EUMVA|nr:hypothetical protein EVAR_9658_1 [Eumeta japonica]
MARDKSEKWRRAHSTQAPAAPYLCAVVRGAHRAVGTRRNGRTARADYRRRSRIRAREKEEDEQRLKYRNVTKADGQKVHKLR